jgi:hypothetical protein
MQSGSPRRSPKKEGGNVTTEILIDPNVRVAGNETFSGFEDVVGDFPAEGARVRVRELESNIVGEGVVTRVDEHDRLIYLAIDWSKLAPEQVMTPDELMRRLGIGAARTSTTTALTAGPSETYTRARQLTA